MPAASKTIGVRISSAFRDIDAERDVLNGLVFPESRSRCRELGVESIGIDLPWGLTGEETQEASVPQPCLGDVERSRLYFMCLVGEWCGWVPAPQEVERQFHEAVEIATNLPLAERHMKGDPLALNRTEARFVQKSWELRERRLWRFRIVLTAVMLVLSALTVVAIWQALRARAQLLENYRQLGWTNWNGGATAR
jgi:hypothetical protein